MQSSVPLDQIAQIKAQPTALLIFRRNGAAYAMGANDFGQLCQPFAQNVNASLGGVQTELLGDFLPVSLKYVDYAAAGTSHSLLVANNSLYVCGLNGLYNQSQQIVNASKQYLIYPHLMPFGFGVIEDVAIDDELLLVLTNQGLFALGHT